MEKRIFEETDGVRGKVGEEPLTPKTMRRLGGAIGRYFGGGKVLIGRDTRASGKWIETEMLGGMNAAGADVALVGVTTTPMMAILAQGMSDVAGAVMITASHNPASDNGVKVFDGKGDKLTNAEELAVEQIFFEKWAEDDEILQEQPTMEGAAQKYIDRLAELTSDEKFDGYKVCVDSAAGGAWEIARTVFASFGVQATEVGPESNGENINENSGAMHPENLAQKVVELRADLGVALDGDADRVMLVDDLGRVWDGDRLVTLLAGELKREGKLTGDRVVMTEYSNLGAVNYAKSLGISVEKVVNGDRAVAEKCRETGTVLGSEVAGHIIYTDWLSSSDGLMVALLTLAAMKKQGRKLSELWPDYEMVPQKLWNIMVKEKVPLADISGWAEALAKWSAYLGDDGRLFARYSGTEKKLRILVESVDEAKMTEAGEALSKIIKEEIGV